MMPTVRQQILAELAREEEEWIKANRGVVIEYLPGQPPRRVVPRLPTPIPSGGKGFIEYPDGRRVEIDKDTLTIPAANPNEPRFPPGTALMQPTTKQAQALGMPDIAGTEVPVDWYLNESRRVKAEAASAAATHRSIEIRNQLAGEKDPAKRAALEAELVKVDRQRVQHLPGRGFIPGSYKDGWATPPGYEISQSIVASGQQYYVPPKQQPQPAPEGQAGVTGQRPTGIEHPMDKRIPARVVYNQQAIKDLQYVVAGWDERISQLQAEMAKADPSRKNEYAEKILDAQIEQSNARKLIDEKQRQIDAVTPPPGAKVSPGGYVRFDEVPGYAPPPPLGPWSQPKPPPGSEIGQVLKQMQAEPQTYRGIFQQDMLRLGLAINAGKMDFRDAIMGFSLLRYVDDDQKSDRFIREAQGRIDMFKRAIQAGRLDEADAKTAFLRIVKQAQAMASDRPSAEAVRQQQYADSQARQQDAIKQRQAEKRIAAKIRRVETEIKMTEKELKDAQEAAKDVAWQQSEQAKIVDDTNNDDDVRKAARQRYEELQREKEAAWDKAEELHEKLHGYRSSTPVSQRKRGGLQGQLLSLQEQQEKTMGGGDEGQPAAPEDEQTPGEPETDALPMPADQSQLVAGKRYDNGKGVVGVYRGNGQWEVSQ